MTGPTTTTNITKRSMMVVTAIIQHHQIKVKAAIKVHTLSVISVDFTTMAPAEEIVKGVAKGVMLQRIVEPNSRVTNNNNNPRINSSRVTGVTREGREEMERGVIIVEVKHISKGTAHS